MISFTSLMPLLPFSYFVAPARLSEPHYSMYGLWTSSTGLPGSWLKGKISSISKFSESALNMILRWFTRTLKWEKHCSGPAKSSQSCPTLCDPMDCSLRGSSVHGILQAKILGWIAMPHSQGIFLTQGSNQCLVMSPTLQGASLPLAPPGKPKHCTTTY